MTEKERTLFKENKRKKFLELANSRVNKTLTGIKLIGNLSRKNNYEYSEKDVKTIFNALEQELKTAKALFNKGNGAEDKDEFRLE
mgnify:CR=1 FL=1|jgi:hypothetical protein|tara:strand:- start:387 stop:641 length:255 start_codon:yes stop_codon:yes gene_type:complete